jgi:hypothetical protein
MTDDDRDAGNGLTDGALRDVFTSTAEGDGPANVVDMIRGLAQAVDRVARAVTPDAAPGRDRHGGVVGSLTEAVMSVGASLDAIAQAMPDAPGVAESLDGVARSLDGVADALRPLNDLATAACEIANGLQAIAQAVRKAGGEG